MPDDTATYPRRPSHFAHKFCRILMRCCVAQDIGPDAAYMLTQIVHTEDAAHYRRPIRFFNDQLVAACGFANVKALQRSRDKAVASGWLHYEEGARSRPAIYWVMIPAWAADVDSGPMDEGIDAPNGRTKDTFIVKIENRKSKTVTQQFAKIMNKMPKFINLNNLCFFPR